MPTSLANRTFWVALLCSLLLVLRIGEAHLHMCLDGQESPVALHFVDVGFEHPFDEGAEHNDTNVSMGAGDLAKLKLSSLELDLPVALLLVLAVLLAGVVTRSPHPRKASTAFVRSISWLRPPLRGPPLMART